MVTLTTGGRTEATAFGTTDAIGGTRGAVEATGDAMSGTDALGADSEAVGATLALATIDVAGAECVGSAPVFRRITTTTRIASATPTTDPAAITAVRRRFCCRAAA